MSRSLKSMLRPSRLPLYGFEVMPPHIWMRACEPEAMFSSKLLVTPRAMLRSTMSMKMPQLTDSPVRAVRSLLWLSACAISLKRSLMAR